jgi:hypothetical protein
MPNQPELLREQLLARGEPSREKLTRYREETEAMLNQLDRRLRLEKWGAGAMWIFAVLFMTGALLIAGFWGRTSPELWIVAFGFVLLVSGGVEVVKHFINRSRVEILKELKGLELQVLELKENQKQAV